MLFFFAFQESDTIQKMCDETCACHSNGEWLCVPRCTGEYFKRGTKPLGNPLCTEKPAAHDPECCSVMSCDKMEKDIGKVTIITTF